MSGSKNSKSKKRKLTALELCAGGGGQFLGIEQAGFRCAAAVEIEPVACETLRLNRPKLRVIEADIREVDGSEFQGIDLLAAGVPCPPFSIAGKQLGQADERDLFPEALRIIGESQPRAVMLENVRGFASEKFKEYRARLLNQLAKMGFECGWKLIQAADLGLPQLRPRFVLVALHAKYVDHFVWPKLSSDPPTVGEVLYDLIAQNGWKGAKNWASKANKIGPTIVGGSKKHGGPDLGPTRAKAQWAEMGVDGNGVANEPPGADFPNDGNPKLTTRMVARLQGFPDDWKFAGRKTAAYRQVGNAFPPAVAKAVASAIHGALTRKPGLYETKREETLFPQYMVTESA